MPKRTKLSLKTKSPGFCFLLILAVHTDNPERGRAGGSVPQTDGETEAPGPTSPRAKTTAQVSSTPGNDLVGHTCDWVGFHCSRRHLTIITEAKRLKIGTKGGFTDVSVEVIQWARRTRHTWH